MKAKAITEGKVHGPGAKQQQMELAGLVEYEPFDFPDGKTQKEYGGTSEQWTQFIGAFAIALPTIIALCIMHGIYTCSLDRRLEYSQVFFFFFVLYRKFVLFLEVAIKLGKSILCHL